MKPKPVDVRPATPEDVDAIVDVHIASWKLAYRGKMPDAFLEHLGEQGSVRAAGWHAAVAAIDQRVLIAQREGRVIGFAALGRARDPDGGGAGEVYAIYAHPAAWDTGAGRALMRTALEQLRELGYQEATLWVLDSNERARRFYEKGGWRADGATKLDQRFDPPLHEVRYRIVLAAAATGRYGAGVA